MKLPSETRFADAKIRKAFYKLHDGDYSEKELFKFINQAMDNIEENAFCGIQIPKKQIPKNHINPNFTTRAAGTSADMTKTVFAGMETAQNPMGRSARIRTNCAGGSLQWTLLGRESRHKATVAAESVLRVTGFAYTMVKTCSRWSQLRPYGKSRLMSIKGVFGMKSPSDFWISIRTAYGGYQNSSPKKVELILYVVMGLYHLTDWIVNEFDDDRRIEAKQFREQLNRNRNYETIFKICTRSKHTKAPAPKTSAKYVAEQTLSQMGEMNRWKTMSQGSPDDFYVGDENIISIVDDVIREYTRWFEKTTKE